MVFTIVRVENSVYLYSKTERELRHELKTPFEVLEIHKNQHVAEQRLNDLQKTQYKKRRKPKGKVSEQGRKNISLSKQGEKNPMYGPITEGRRRAISNSQRGNQYRRGKKLSTLQRIRHKEIHKKVWVERRLKEPKRKWCHCPETGKELLTPIDEKPYNYCWGRSPDFVEAFQYFREQGAKRRKRKL